MRTRAQPTRADIQDSNSIRPERRKAATGSLVCWIGTQPAQLETRLPIGESDLRYKSLAGLPSAVPGRIVARLPIAPAGFLPEVPALRALCSQWPRLARRIDGRGSAVVCQSWPCSNRGTGWRCAHTYSLR